MPENASIDRIQRRGRVGELYVTKYGPITTGKDGVSAGSVEFFVSDYDLAFGLQPRVERDRHPRFPQLLCQESVVNYLKPGAASIVATYAGLGDGLASEGLSFSVEIEVTPALRELPIEAHEKFEQWKQFANYDDDTGQFIGWKFPSGHAAAKWFTQDTKSYLEPTVTMRRSFTSTSKPTLVNLRRIYMQPTGAPAVDGRNWLLMSIPYRTIGENMYAITEEFLLSGPNGWNPYVYGDLNL